MPDEEFLERKLAERRVSAALRRLRLPEGKVDFCSNDYLGIATRGMIERVWEEKAGGVRNGLPEDGGAGVGAGEIGRSDVVGDGSWGAGSFAHGSGGSRLLAGNYALVEATERQLAAFHAAPAGLIYNSGYDANLGLLSCVPQRGDVVLYDELSHASIRDGMRLSFARHFSFSHNDCGVLEEKLETVRAGELTIFVVTESVFSMDGDCAPLREMAALCRKYNAQLIVDEAHGTGVVGQRGEGLVQELGLEGECFARIHTFGKAVGCHGAIVLGSPALREYLINFSRAFIYTTALSPASVRAIATAYALLPGLGAEREQLRRLIGRWRAADIGYRRLDSSTPIQVVIVPGNDVVRALAERLQEEGMDVRPILYPTVPKGSERLRIVLHSYNTEEEVDRLAGALRRAAG